MTPPRSPSFGLRVEQLEDRLTPAGSTIPAGEFNWLQYSPTGELAELVWEGQNLVYRTRAANGWQESTIATAPTFTQSQYDTRDQVEKASQSAQLVFTGDGTPHVLYLDPVWVSSSNAYQTVVRDYARINGQWQLSESITAPWLSTWGPNNLIAEAGAGNSLHILFTETYTSATGVGNQGTGILWYGTNKSGSWQFSKVSDTADLKTDVWFSGGRWAPRFLSLTVDAQNNAYVAYTPQFYIAGAFSTVYSELKFATNRSGSWQSQTVYSPPSGTGDAGLGASIAVSPSGQVAIASYFVNRYSSGSPQSSALMYHTWNADGSWTHTVVANAPDGYSAKDGANYTGFSPQLYFDASGRPNIVFSDEAAQHLPVTYANEFSGQIRLATLSNGKWSLQTLYRQSNPLTDQLFYPIAATYNGQTAFAGLRVSSQLDANQNIASSDFSLVELNLPSGPATPVAGAAPPPAGPSGGSGSPAQPPLNSPGSSVTPPPPVLSGSSTPAAYAVASDATPGVTTTVAVYRSNGQLDFTITPFGSDYSGGARVVRADVTGDGVPDIIVGSGGGIQARVRIWDGQTHNLIFDATPFEDFTGGVVVAAGDLTGDGIADIILGPDVGGGPRIQIWGGVNGSFQKLVPDFYGLPYPDFRGGLQLAAGDINRDGIADLVVAPGVGGGPRVTVYDGRSIAAGRPTTMINDFFAFDQSLRTGIYLAVGDVNGDGFADVIVGAGENGSPRVRVFSGADIAAGRSPNIIADFYAASMDERNGVRVGVAQGPDGRTAILTGTAGSQLSLYTGAASASGPNAALSFSAFNGMAGGVFVG